jgi:hypothetical protein
MTIARGSRCVIVVFIVLSATFSMTFPPATAWAILAALPARDDAAANPEACGDIDIR